MDQIDVTSCSATWSGYTVSQQLTIRLEVSTPDVHAVPTRPPDFNGWYHSPVAIAFDGTAFSGIASCTTATYTGPDTPNATVGGSCTDHAGKTVGVTSLPFAYDADPSLAVTTDPGDDSVVLRWEMADVAPFETLDIVRSPGLRGRKSSLLYSGPGFTYRDVHVRDGVRYRYTLQARDQAGNLTVRDVIVTPGPRLLAPADGAPVNTLPLLLWTPVRGASYYNVQLYWGARKVLSAWPSRAGLQLERSWFYGRRRRLRPGRYRWFVWAGFGRRDLAKYGRAIGSRTFVFTPVA
jgi:hypothetical protein